MKDSLSLDDLTLFLAVAEAGGLAGAVSVTGQSAPTLSRKMASLEKRLGDRLFLRGARGYALTTRGRALREEAAVLRGVHRRLTRWAEREAVPRVRITAGTWTAHWLVLRLRDYWREGEGWVPEFLGSNAVLDIARREADIGFRNRRPDQPWLAGRRLRRIAYAEYALGPDITDFATLSADEAKTRSARWVHANRADRIVTTVNDPRLALDLARQGMARVVLPTFVGAESGLAQVSDLVDELTHEEWLVTHHEARHDPPVRAAIDAIVRYVGRQTA